MTSRLFLPFAAMATLCFCWSCTFSASGQQATQPNDYPKVDSLELDVDNFKAILCDILASDAKIPFEECNRNRSPNRINFHSVIRYRISEEDEGTLYILYYLTEEDRTRLLSCEHETRSSDGFLLNEDKYEPLGRQVINLNPIESYLFEFRDDNKEDAWLGISKGYRNRVGINEKPTSQANNNSNNQPRRFLRDTYTFYKSDSDVVNPAELNKVMRVIDKEFDNGSLNKAPPPYVSIACRADSPGDFEDNKTLSMNRACSLLDEISKKKDNLKTILNESILWFFGEELPLGDETDLGASYNRACHLTIWNHLQDATDYYQDQLDLLEDDDRTVDSVDDYKHNRSACGEKKGD